MAIYNVNKDTGDITETAGRYGSSEEYTEISYENWLALTPAQQENGKWDVTGVPDADGTVSIDLMTKLWENPDTTQSFAAQNIQLTSSDYDMLVIIPLRSTSNQKTIQPVIIPKGKDGYINFTDYLTGSVNAVIEFYRALTRVSDTEYSVSVCKYGASSQSGTDLVPYIIYGIKTTASVKVSAIAENVSTSADKCMLSDGVTSVEDVVECTQTTAGNYRLRATVGAGGTVTYSWVAE